MAPRNLGKSVPPLSGDRGERRKTGKDLSAHTPSPKTVGEAFRELMRLHNLTYSTLAQALGASNVESTARALWRFANDKNIPRERRSLELLARVQNYLELPDGYFAEIIANGGLSYLRRPCNTGPFQKEFAYQMSKHCDSCESLAGAVGQADCKTITETFANWKTGRSQPRWRRYLRVLSKIEIKYGLPEGHFRALLIKPLSPYQAFLKSVPQTFRQVVRWHLPKDFDTRPLDAQKEITTWIMTNVIANGTKFGQYQSSITRAAFTVIFPNLRGLKRQRRRDGLERFSKTSSSRIGSTVVAPPKLAAEMQDFALFKTSSLPPTGLRRFTKWSAATADAEVYSYGIVFGALAASPESHARGCGISHNDLSFGILAFPKVWDWYVRWREQRRGFFTPNEAKVLVEAKSNLRRPAGWIRQHPELALRLQPIDGLISEEEVAAAQIDWDAT